MTALTLDQVGKRYGEVEVIEKLSLEVEPGEFVVFLGPSGCGKTSLLRMVAGLEAVTSGRIHIGGDDVTDWAPGRRNLAMVFQHFALYPHMTVSENLAFGLRNVGTPVAEIGRRVAEAARMLELDSLLARKPEQLSSGQCQRVAIGRAVVKEPGLFLFDEPLSNLDAALRGRTRVELAGLHRRLGATMVFVTHDQLEAMTLATRIVVMNHGEIEQVGTPVEVYRRPATRFVAAFIGAPAMNFFAVTRGPALNGMASVLLPGGAQWLTQVAASALAGGALELGVRPENLRLATQGTLQGRVELVEFLGDRTLAHVRLADGSLASSTVSGVMPLRGENVALAPDPAELHLFDAAGRAHAASRTPAAAAVALGAAA